MTDEVGKYQINLEEINEVEKLLLTLEKSIEFGMSNRFFPTKLSNFMFPDQRSVSRFGVGDTFS